MPALRQLFFILFMVNFMNCQNDNFPTTFASYEDYPVYTGTDLGLTYSPEQSVFKLWAPAASEAKLLFYKNGAGGSPFRETSMQRKEKGVWVATFSEDLEGTFYTFQTKVNDQWGDEVPDPYVKAVGVNGKRGQVIDFAKTNPDGWENDQRPPLQHPTDIILYELHVRDISMHNNSGIQHQGKFLGLVEPDTKSPDGLATGLDHFKEMGITHVHLLPSYDYLSVDESKPEDNEFNWGYDPQNYNVPEGSYSTNPNDGATRVREFKQMVKAFHDNNIRVILDVVYNHTGATEGSNFNQLVPGYYYRQNAEGGFSNASACGNETASDRAMMRKFIVESVLHWVNEYHLDGFRFDLMGIHDITTMNEIREALHKIDPTIFIYGEGWTAGDSPLPEPERALKKHTHRLNGVAAFSDDMRDGLKGSVFDAPDRGFASGKPNTEESVKFGIVAATRHPQVDYSKVNYSNEPWSAQPGQCINYVSCHDNHTLWDRMVNSHPEASEAERIQMHKLANVAVLTSQGVPFLHAGVEMLRTKGGEENSFESPDEVNRIDWSRKKKYQNVVDYYKGLIALRKNHPAFRMPAQEMIEEHLKFLPFEEGSLLVGYVISDNANGDSWKNILVLLNGNLTNKTVQIPTGEWTQVLDGQQINQNGFQKVQGSVTLPASSAAVYYQN